MNSDNTKLGGGFLVPPSAAPITPVEGQDGTFQIVPDVTTSLSLLIGGGEAPQVNVSAWGGECSFALTLLSGMPVLPPPGRRIPPQNLQAVQLSGAYLQDESTQAVSWQGTDRSSSFSSVAHSDETPEGALEFDVTLQSRPDNDEVVFQLDFDNCTFHRQPFISEQIGQIVEGNEIVTADDTTGYDADGNIVAQCPDNIPGSYAVYHTAPPNNYEGGTLYKTGKIGHLYRPLITDSDGNTVWGTMTVDPGSGLLTIAIPPDFLDNADANNLYPIIVDPTFGYTTIGGTRSPKSPGSDDICPVSTGLTYVATTGDTIVSYTIYADGGGSTGGHMDVAAYSIVAGVPVSRLAAAVTVNTPASASWVSSAAVSQGLTNGVRYGFGVGNYATPTWTYYDTGTGNQQCTNAGGALPATWTSTGFATSMGSRYVTYTGTIAASQIDTGSAVSTQSATAILLVNQAEAGSALSAQSASYIGRPSQAEATTASSTQSATSTIPVSISEPTSATDTQVASYTTLAAISEDTNADDLTSANYDTTASIDEPAAAIDASDTIEQQVEPTSATDEQSTVCITDVSCSEDVIAIDEQSAISLVIAEINEPATAMDECAVGATLNTGISIHYAIEIFTDTALSDSLMGLVDGVFRFVTDDAPYDGGVVPKYGPHEIDAEGNDVGGDDVLPWFYGQFLMKEAITANPARTIDIVSLGNYATESQFSFAIRNDVKFWDYCRTNSINLTGKRVVMWISINNIFYQCARGRIKNNPYTEIDFTFNVGDGSELIHKNIPPRLSTLSGVESKQGDPVPVIFGNVPYSKIVKNNMDNYILPLNPLYTPAAATNYNISGPPFVYTLTLYSSEVFIASDPRLVGKYLSVMAGLFAGSPVTIDRIYKITDNTASSSGLFTITFAAPLVRSTSGDGSSDILLYQNDFNNPSNHHCLTGTYPNYVSTADTWWFQISDYSQVSYVSNKPVTVSDILQHDSNTKTYNSVDSLLNLASTPNPTVELITNTATKDGKVTQYERINIPIVEFGLANSSNVPFEYYTDDVSIGKVTDKKRGTDKPFTTVLPHQTSIYIYADYIPQPVQPAANNAILSNSYDALYFCVDLEVHANIADETKLKFTGLRPVVTDVNDSVILCSPNAALPDTGYLVVVPNDEPCNFVPNNLISDTGSDPSTLFGAQAQLNGHTYRAILKLYDWSPSVFTSAQLKKVRLEILMENTELSTFTIKIKEISLVGERQIDTLTADMFARTRGEVITGGSTPADNVYRAFQHILEDYDGIPPALIDYGSLATDRASWPVSRTLTDQKNSIDYLNELCAHSFVGMFPGRTGKRTLRVFQGFSGALTPTAGSGKTSVHDEFLIVKNSISSYEKSSLDNLYNSFLLQYCYDAGSKGFIRSFNIAHVEEASFPASGTADPDDAGIPLWWSYFSGLQTSKDDWSVGYAASKVIWDICHASYLLNGVVKQAQGDVSQLSWFADSLIWDSTDTSGTGTSCSAYKLLLLLAQWCTLQKDTVAYSIPINANTCETELLDVVCFNDIIYTNGSCVEGWVVGLEVDASKDQYNITTLLQPRSLV